MIHGALVGFSRWLSATTLSNVIQTRHWIIPTLQTIHILCVAVLFSSVIIVDLRVLRILQRDAPLSSVADRFLPVVVPAVLVLLVTGSLLIIGEPRRALLNDTFYWKMGLLLLALMLTAWLGRSFRRTFRESDGGGAQYGAWLAAALSVLAWCGVLFAGRWIAYTQVG
jgi:putative copper export protein